MSAKLEQGITMADRMKLVIATLIAIAGVVGFYRFEDLASGAVRGVVLVFVLAAAVGVAALSGPGQRTWSFMQDANLEVRKVVWPTRQEATQTTLVILVCVAILGVILWLIDWMLAGMVRSLMGR